jgi:peptidoglycan hydrolase CwlO-like protein
MTTLLFVGTWALRSAIVVLATAALLGMLRVRSSSVRLAAWTAALFASILIPVLAPVLPAIRVPMAFSGRPTSLTGQPLSSGTLPLAVLDTTPPTKAAPGIVPRGALQPLLLAIYGLGSGLLLARTATGLALTRRILRRGAATDRTANGVPILESRDLTVPAVLGVWRVSVVLPEGWAEWEPAKLDSVLAHEISHVTRHDPAVQLLSAMHRALLWFSPASWWMHSRIVRLGEEASDDAALAASRDRASYAEVLLHFLERRGKLSHWEGLAMARYGSAQERIHRILDGTSPSRTVTRAGLAAIAAIAAPAVFLAAAVTPMDPELKRSVPSPLLVSPPPPQSPPEAPSLRSAPLPPAQSGSGAHPTAFAGPVSTPLAKAASGAPDPTPAGRVTASSSSASSSEKAQAPAEINRYLIVDGDSMSGSWDSDNEQLMSAWRARYGSKFAWFRLRGHDYFVTDDRTLAELHEAMAPQREVNAKQSEVNRAQAEVNRHQAKVNAHQSEVNRAQSEVAERQRQVHQGVHDGAIDSTAQSRVNEMQSEVNARQSVVNEEQHAVNEEQHVVNGRQEIVNRTQERVSREIRHALSRIFEDAVRSGVAREAE